MKRKFETVLLGFIMIAVVVIAVKPCSLSKNISTAEDFSQKVNVKSYSTNIKELRDKFNQDKGKVRLVLLLSPT